MAKRRSSMKKKNYAESSDSEECFEDEEDFEPVKKRTRNARKELPARKKRVCRKSSDKIDDLDINIDEDDKRDVDTLKGNSLVNFGLVSRPNLSESESSDDDMNIADIKESLKAKKTSLRDVKEKVIEPKSKNSVENNMKSISKERTHEGGKGRVGDSVKKKEETERLERTSVKTNCKAAKQEVFNEIKMKNEKEKKNPSLKNKLKNTVVSEVSDDQKIKGKSLLRAKITRKDTASKEKEKLINKTIVKTEKQMSDRSSVRLKRQNILKEVKERKKKVELYCMESYEFMDCKPGPSHHKAKVYTSDDDDSEDDWEDVHEADISKSFLESPKKKDNMETDFKDIAINLKVNSIHKTKSEKNKDLFKKYLEKTMRKFHQDLQNNKHKDHLICLVARTIFLNKQSNNSCLQAICLSFVPLSITKVPKNKWDILQFKKLLNWFQNGIPDTDSLVSVCHEETPVLKNISKIQVFVALLRALGFLVRIITSLQPMSPKVETLFRLGGQSKNSVKPAKQKAQSTTEQRSQSKAETPKKELNTTTSPYFKNTSGNLPGESGKKQIVKTKKMQVRNQGNSKKDLKQFKTDPVKHRGLSDRTRKRKTVNYADSEEESGIESGHDDDPEKPTRKVGANPSEQNLSTRLSTKVKEATQSPAKRCRTSKSITKPYETKLLEKIDDDDDFEMTSKPLSRKKSNSVSPKPVKVISSDSETEKPKQKKKKKQVTLRIGVDLNGNTIDEPDRCEKMASQPLQYVIGIDNDEAIKDVTCRYAAKFMTETRKLRIDREWWAETLKPYETKNKKMEELEDQQLHMELLSRPMPKSISEFKNHPLYVLEADLLKFEAIYPKSAAILGYVGSKAVYSRECVHVLHTRENWLKEARVVKQGEEAYKIVKGRPKRNTPVHERDKVKIDLFGFWQTEVYKPPPIKNGKVPRNEYGNVEMFKPCMLPPGGVHIPIQGIHKVARKLDIDAAPAMMGWDFHSGCAHPIIEGVIVAEEYEEKLLDAWQREVEEIEKKKHQKKQQKIYDRWKLLVKGLLVRERIKRKYDFREHDESDHKRSQKGEDNIAADDVSISWPLNKMEGKTSLNEKGHHHIFPASGHKQDKITGEWTKSCSCGLTMPFEKL